MTEEEKKNGPEDQCAQSCHEDWQQCREQAPEEPSPCHTRLARCVKTCTTDEKGCDEKK